MTSLFSYSPDALEEIQLLYLSYINKQFENCACGCRGFPINLLTLDFNEKEIDLDAYIKCPARHERGRLPEYQTFKSDPIYINFLKEIYPERYGYRQSIPPSQKQIRRQLEAELNARSSYYKRLAIEKNQSTFQGKPCVNGHAGVRDVRNNECIDCKHFGKSLRDAIKRGAFREKLSTNEKLEISKIYNECKTRSKKSGVIHHVDHIKPLAAGGRHHPLNLQILTANENLKKGAKFKGKQYTFSQKEKKDFAKNYLIKNEKQPVNTKDNSDATKSVSISQNSDKGFWKNLFK